VEHIAMLNGVQGYFFCLGWCNKFCTAFFHFYWLNEIFTSFVSIGDMTKNAKQTAF